MSDAELLKGIEEFIHEFTQLMSVDAAVRCTVTKSDDSNQRVIGIYYEGTELGYMIGNHGDHLRGLQYVLSLMINNKFGSEEERFYVNVDVSGYRQSKFEQVERTAMRLADDARILGDAIDMEPMNSAERRVAHMTLSKFDDITTESHGEGSARFVRIIPKTEKELGLMPDSEVEDILATDEFTAADEVSDEGSDEATDELEE